MRAIRQVSEFLHKKRKPRVQNVSSFGGSTPEPPLTSNFVFSFSLSHSSSLPFWVIFQTGHTHTERSRFFSIPISFLLSSSSSCVITTHRHSKEFKFIIFFLPSFLCPSVFLREMMNYFGFPFCLLSSSTRSPFSTHGFFVVHSAIH